MKRKLLILFFVVITCLACAFGVAACGEDKPKEGGNGQGTANINDEDFINVNYKSLGLLLIIDSSGSMRDMASDANMTRMELAKEAAVASVECLSSNDYVGVISFNNNATREIEMSSMDRSDTVIQRIRNIQTATGTYYEKALRMARDEMMSFNETDNRHIIFITDGEPVDQTNAYLQIISQLKQSGVTMSTIALGPSVPTDKVEQMAQYGGGRFYNVERESQLTRIMIEETTAVIEKPSENDKPTVVEVTSVILNKTTLALEAGGVEMLTAIVAPANATDKTVSWQSSDSTVAKVENGKVTALKAGTATITATAGGKSSTCTVTVTEKVIAVTNVTLNKTTLSLEVDGVETLTATVLPSNATDKTVTWQSSDSTVVKVGNGKVTALKAGTAIITATAGGKSDVCTVTVSEKVIAVTSVTLNKTTLSLEVDSVETLIATVSPSNATNKTVIWGSSDSTVAKVENGKVTALKAGTTTITATCENVSASCEVTAGTFITNLYFSEKEYLVSIGQSIARPVVYYYPSNATNASDLKFEIEDKTIIEYSGGYLTGLSSGTTTLTVTTSNGVTASCVIRCIDISFKFVDTPFKISNWTNPAYYVTQTATIEEITYSLTKRPSGNDNFSLDINIKGLKTSCIKSSSDVFKINYKIYSSDNTVIKSGTFTSTSCSVGERFLIDTRIYLDNLKEDNYRIEFSDVAW